MILTCRLCLTENSEEKLKNVFQCNIKYAEETLVDVLFWIFSVEIDVTDPFSKDICGECVQLIEYILQIKNTFQKNQIGLKNQQNQNDHNLGVQALADVGIEKFCYGAQKLSSSNSTPTNSPSKSRYRSKNVYDNCSPRVRVSLSALEAMCPMNLDIIPLEKSQEYLRYRRLKNGSFKKRKYRHFDLDKTLLDDICNTLNDKRWTKSEPFKKEIGVGTEISTLSKAVNTDEVAICTCDKNTTSPLKYSPTDVSSIDILSTNKCTKEIKYTSQSDNFLEISGIVENSLLNLSSPDANREDDWTKLTFKKDASTNTDSNKTTTKDIGINAKVHTVTTGTLTKKFGRTTEKNIVQVDIDSLESFGPRVFLEPLEDILEHENYEQIDTFRYVKKDYSSSESETEEDLAQNKLKNDWEDNEPNITVVEVNKKQKFLDYYKNFSSFAVRELITGKKIRESDNDTSPVFDITNVCNVLVCDYCSKSFLSKISLNLHYKRAHKTVQEPSNVIKVLDLIEKQDEPPPTKEIKKQSGPSEKIMENVKSEGIWKDVCHSRNISNKMCKKTLVKPVENKIVNNAADTLPGLKRKAQKVNYNINDIIRLKTRVKQNVPGIKRKRRRQNKFKRLGKLLLSNENKEESSYIWDRKGLGKYSAISYYKSYSGDGKALNLNLAHCDIKHKNDLALNETIEKLATRLDEDSNKDV